MATLLVADDSTFDRELVGRILADDPSFTVEMVENGRLALERLKQGGVDLVLTDLEMPEVNGFQVVTTMRVDFPNVPVILMTGVGSEVVAMDALEQGAASYVPKRKLNERLLETIRDVMAVALTARAYQELINCFDSTDFSLTLGSDSALFDPLVDYVQQIVGGMNLCDASEGYRLGVALREALFNALYRGNLEITSEQMSEESERLLLGKPSLVEERRNEEPYCNRKIYVHVQVGSDEAKLTVRDEGPGFDVTSLPTTSMPNALGDSGGRGIVLMRTHMDEVTFSEEGNSVTMVKRSAALKDA